MIRIVFTGLKKASATLTRLLRTSVLELVESARLVSDLPVECDFNKLI